MNPNKSKTSQIKVAHARAREGAGVNPRRIREWGRGSYTAYPGFCYSIYFSTTRIRKIITYSVFNYGKQSFTGDYYFSKVPL